MSHFKLPEWRELSRDEQIPIVNLPVDRTYFVNGGPGTGKSILAIHRLAKLRDLAPNTKTKLLVYNKPLQLHLKDALHSAGLERSTVQTCHAWIGQLAQLPLPSSLWGYDWSEVRRRILVKTGSRKIFGHLILDEAQDIPVPLLKILHEISDTATMFADGKQAINPEAKEASEGDIYQSISQCFGLGPNSTFYLGRNFRNTQPILDAAHAIKPMQPYEISDIALRKDGPRPNLRRASIEVLARRIETYHSNNPADRIAVAVPRRRDFDVYNHLSQSEVPTQIYRNKHIYEGTYNACAKGATVLAYEVMKGLEFDAVFMPFLDDPYLHHERTADEIEINQNIIYVVSTRARSFLEYSHDGDLPASWLTDALNSACEAGLIRRV